MTALTAALDNPAPVRHPDWVALTERTPQLTATVWRYLDQIALSLRPATIDAVATALRGLVGHLADQGVDCFAAVERGHIETYKRWLAITGTHNRRPPARNTIRQRLGMVRSFFDRIIEWDWPDAPRRTPMFAIDVPAADDPLPKFLDDAQAARLLGAASRAKPLDRLVVEILARTGLRASELCDLDADAVGRIGGAWWLRVPVGKLRNDRYIPLHPALVELLAAWPTGHQHLIEVDGRALDRHRVGRIVQRVAKTAGLGHVHPHQLRHTLATQAINRGMRLEAIAALLGHRSLRMTLTYARIANRTVADEYAATQARVDALYDHSDEPADLTRLRHEHRRMLGNGWCTRPRGTDCAFEAICEGCGYYQTGVEFAPTLRAQRDHAASHGQTTRVELYGALLDRLEASR
ncbi:MAG: tyrosine-type recombinase/integrase [Acidimicrobiales bacterium]